jgi:predicted esterase
MRPVIDSRDPHADLPLVTGGRSPAQAQLALVLVHGRGGSAEDVLALAGALRLRDVAYVAPQAGGNTWYPKSFLVPMHQNEPELSSAFRVLARLVDTLNRQGLETSRIGFLGFSQGACLALEFVARHPSRYAGLFALSGGLMGPPHTPRKYHGSLAGTPVFLGCGDRDPHIPLERVDESAEVFQNLEAIVDKRIYPQMGHTVNDDEILAIRLTLDGSTSHRKPGSSAKGGR